MLLSDVFFIVIFPLSTSTFSSKLRTIFASTAILVALSAGVDESRVGAVVSAACPKNSIYSAPKKVFACFW